jgi:hypothetical protein
MKNIAFCWLVAVGLIISGCSSTKVAVEFDEQADFSQYKRFAFITPKPLTQKPLKKPMLVRDPLFAKKARREIAAVLAGKGYQTVDSPDSADFLVAFYATAQNRANFTPPAYHVGRFGRRWVTPGHVYYYKQGTLIVDIVDRRQRELVWRGVGVSALDRNDPTNNLVRAIDKILTRFPPN